jgi:quercetin dioxygenase-like cupin family protein
MKRPPKNKQLEALDARAAAALAEAIRPAELTQRQRDSMRGKIAKRISPKHISPERLSQAQPTKTHTVRADAVEWRALSPNVRAKVLRLDPDGNLQMVLLRLEPGGVIPGHAHTKEEECLVLAGEILIGAHRVGEGDLHIAEPGAAHEDITTRTGATLLVRSEIPPQYLRTLRARRAHAE